MQLVCVECHKVKTHADRLGVSFEEAKIKKEVIRFSKLPESEQVATLTEYKVAPSKSKAGRLKQYAELKGGKLE